jgi:hypothetical protein
MEGKGAKSQEKGEEKGAIRSEKIRAGVSQEKGGKDTKSQER